MSNTGAQPRDEDFVAVREYTGITPAEAIILLKKWPSWTDAVQHYFEDPVGSLKEDKAVDSRRWEPQDNIPYKDAQDLVGMSRPPSRNEDSNRMIDLTEEHAQATARSQFEIEQDDYKRAIEESMKSMPDQESGVTVTGHTFGPANRPHYDPSQWALAPLASSREVLEHPIPSQRRRGSEQPTFLWGSSDTGYLAPLLTIYHSIPLAREALLFPSFQPYSYGHDSSWWSGSTDENNKTISVEHSDSNSKNRRNLLCEIQCLMAFLEKTDRAYGSVDALANLHLYVNITAESSFTRFLHAWNYAAMAERHDDQLTQVFTSTAIKASDQPNLESNKKDLYCLEAPMPPGEGHTTLGELLDDVVWNDTNLPLDDVWIDHAAEVFTMRIYASGNANSLELTIPEIWYADRYLDECRDILRDMRERRMTLMSESRALTVIQRRLAEFNMPDGVRRNVRQVLDASVKLAPIAADHSLTEEAEPFGDDLNIELSALQNQLGDLLQAIETKMKEMDKKKAWLIGRMRQVMLDLTEPSDQALNQPRHKYFLQGVSTKPNITYVRRPNHDLLGLDNDLNMDSVDEWQWWRIAWNEEKTEFGPSSESESLVKPEGPRIALTMSEATSKEKEQPLNDPKLYSVQKVRSIDVVDAARSEHSSVVLVYARETALNFKNSPFSPALRHFMQQDNRAFEEELQSELGATRRRWSDDTNTTMMDYDSNNENNLISADSQTIATSLKFGAAREADGQPSPKRPRSSEGAWYQQETGDEPPSYESSIETREMQEKRGNKIGFFANQLMEKYGDEKIKPRANSESEDATIHIEHPTQPLR